MRHPPALPPPLELQRSFDPLPGTEPRELVAGNGRTVRYLDEGDADWRPVVFFGGLATSLGAFGLTEFARTTRQALRLRAISVERNGFGETPFDPSLGYREAVDDVLAVLDALDVERYGLVAFSGGAPFAAALAARAPDRVLSLHLASAAAGALTATVGSARELFADAATIVADPAAWWRYPVDSPVHRIPGFAGAAAGEGVRALAAPSRGALALAHEWRLLSSRPLPDLSAVSAPAHLYWGADDAVVPPEHAEAWVRALPNVVAARAYPEEGHDVQYRHWDQIMLDAAGLGAWTLTSRERRPRLVLEPELRDQLAAGATLGLPCWEVEAA